MMTPDRDGKIFVGKGGNEEWLALALANRHGLVTGATGTGKTVTLQVLAEGFSRAGVAVFAADIKGDLSGIAVRGEARPDFVKRAKDLGFDYAPEEFSATQRAESTISLIDGSALQDIDPDVRRGLRNVGIIEIQRRAVTFYDASSPGT